jgi:hypothetical protein
LICARANAAEPCVGLLDLQKYFSVTTPSNGPTVACGSISTVVAKIINRNRTSGRKLEDDKPLNLAEAQKNLAAAMRDPNVRRRIEQSRRNIQDENLRLVYEAAILDEEGYYHARDLRVQQLSERVK